MDREPVVPVAEDLPAASTCVGDQRAAGNVLLVLPILDIGGEGEHRLRRQVVRYGLEPSVNPLCHTGLIPGRLAEAPWLAVRSSTAEGVASG